METAKYVHCYTVPNLDKAETMELIKAAGGSSEDLRGDCVDKILNLTQGNPLYILEYLKDRRDNKSSSSDYSSLDGLISNRIDQLDGRTVRILQCASVMGDFPISGKLLSYLCFEFDRGAQQRRGSSYVLGGGGNTADVKYEEGVNRNLLILVERGMMVCEDVRTLAKTSSRLALRSPFHDSNPLFSLKPELNQRLYKFKNPFISKAAYKMLTFEIKRFLHSKVAEYVELHYLNADGKTFQDDQWYHERRLFYSKGMSKLKALLAYHYAAADKSDLAVTAYEDAALNCGSRMDAKLEQIDYLKHAQNCEPTVSSILEYHKLEGSSVMTTTLEESGGASSHLLLEGLSRRTPEMLRSFFRAAKWDKMIGEAFMSLWRLIPAVKYLRRALVLMTYATPRLDKSKRKVNNIIRKMSSPRRASKTSLMETSNALGLPLAVLFPVVSQEESLSFNLSDGSSSVVLSFGSFLDENRVYHDDHLGRFIPSVLDDIADILKKQKEDINVANSIAQNRSHLSRSSGVGGSLFDVQFKDGSYKEQGDMIVSTLVAVSTLHLWTGCMLRTFLSSYYAVQMSSRMDVVSDDLVEAYSLLYMSTAIVSDNEKVSKQCLQFVTKFIDNMGDHSKAGRCRITCAIRNLAEGNFDHFHSNCDRANLIFTSLHETRECRRIQLLMAQKMLFIGSMQEADEKFDELQAFALERNDKHVYSQCCLLKLVAARCGKVEATDYIHILKNVGECLKESTLWSYLSDLHILYNLMDLRARVVRRIKECDPNHSGSSSDACIQACNPPPPGEELVSKVVPIHSVPSFTGSDFYDELKHFADTCDFVVQTDQICHHLYMTIAFQVCLLV
jgi:hypothetical protein